MIFCCDGDEDEQGEGEQVEKGRRRREEGGGKERCPGSTADVY